MTINATLHAAISGLTAASKSAEVVSSNIANAMTEGYGRREVELSSRANGPSSIGVHVAGVRREVNPVLISDRRLGDAGLGHDTTRADALTRIEKAIGLPGEEYALSRRVEALDTALIDATSRPDSNIRLDSVLRTAQELAVGLVGLSHEVQATRTDADRTIGVEVERLNDALQQIDDLNQQIKRQVILGHQPNGLYDQRQQAIDSIADLVPLRELGRSHGQIALFTAGGSVLLDDQPARIGFTTTPVITPQMNMEDGPLSGLTIDGRPVNVDASGRMGGGRLGALFAVRDEIGPGVQENLDALTRDLIARFEAADAASAESLGLGLFTDAGAALDPSAETGLAQRIAVNPVVDPAQGGALWRLRDGLGAALPDLPGQTDTLRGMTEAFAAPIIPASGAISDVARSFSGLATDFLTGVATVRQVAEARSSYAAALSDTLRELAMSDGVDTDAELHKLLLIERSYAANARVLRAADEMLQTLLGI